MSKKVSELDPKLQGILGSYPVRNPVSWHKENGIAVITYKKEFTKFESWLQRRIGGPEIVRRTMDEMATIIWELSDGRHSIKEICDILDKRYHEEVEPVLEYVHKVLVILLERNLIRLERTKPENPLPVRKQRVLKRSD
jgi:hypothetical protein